MGRRGVRERLQRQTGRCDRGVGNRKADPGPHRGASEGGSDAGVHSAVTSRQRKGSRSEGGRGFRQAQQAVENRPAGIYAQSELRSPANLLTSVSLQQRGGPAPSRTPVQSKSASLDRCIFTPMQ